jgi:hypothetical protein
MDYPGIKINEAGVFPYPHGREFEKIDEKLDFLGFFPLA